MGSHDTVCGRNGIHIPCVPYPKYQAGSWKSTPFMTVHRGNDYISTPCLMYVAGGHMHGQWSISTPMHQCDLCSVPVSNYHLPLRHCNPIMDQSSRSTSPRDASNEDWNIDIHAYALRTTMHISRGAIAPYRKSVWSEFRDPFGHGRGRFLSTSTSTIPSVRIWGSR